MKPAAILWTNEEDLDRKLSPLSLTRFEGVLPRSALQAASAATVLQKRLPVRIFTVDIPLIERKIRFRRVSHSVQKTPNSRLVLGTKETCEEKL